MSKNMNKIYKLSSDFRVRGFDRHNSRNDLAITARLLFRASTHTHPCHAAFYCRRYYYTANVILIL